MTGSKKGSLEGLKTKVGEIVEIAESCPERYRLKCFESLIDAMISAELVTPQALREPGGRTNEGVVNHRTADRRLTLGELKGKFAPKNRLEYVVMVGHWLEKYDGKMDGFSRADVRKYLKQLGCRFGNPSDVILKTLQKGYLMEQKKDSLLLSQTGIDLVVSRLGGSLDGK